MPHTALVLNHGVKLAAEIAIITAMSTQSVLAHRKAVNTELDRRQQHVVAILRKLFFGPTSKLMAEIAPSEDLSELTVFITGGSEAGPINLTLTLPVELFDCPDLAMLVSHIEKHVKFADPCDPDFDYDRI